MMRNKHICECHKHKYLVHMNSQCALVMGFIKVCPLFVLLPPSWNDRSGWDDRSRGAWSLEAGVLLSGGRRARLLYSLCALWPFGEELLSCIKWELLRGQILLFCETTNETVKEILGYMDLLSSWIGIVEWTFMCPSRYEFIKAAAGYLFVS